MATQIPPTSHGGTIEENGVGKFSDFTDEALQGIKQLGTTHVWYTGIPHHAVINDYTEFGLELDDPDVVKGRAGSPYAVKDYYNVNPDLADDPAKRLEEFESLIARTHANGMKVIIDIVPNHVARGYKSLSMPDGEDNFGANDNTSVEYARDNNFYYVVETPFLVPEMDENQQPLGGEKHALVDGRYKEYPAKWTGNGSRSPQPNIHDWYETVKVNYGVRPDGSYDFPKLEKRFEKLGYQEHMAFWASQKLPDSWYKFEKIVHYWLDKGVDGFRYDMAEMVPVEFWSFLNSSIKLKNPDAFIIAEVYQPHLYRDYIYLGKMDYLYDKVEFYDSLKLVMQGKGEMQAIEEVQERMQDIEPHMLHFLENHDEQRIASPGFAGDAEKGKPALVVSALISRSPTMLYFGQDVGEDGSEETGFGDPTRTTIFDYAGVPAHQAWMNNGAFDGGGLTDQQKALRDYHIKVMNISAKHPAMQGHYSSVHSYNIQNTVGYDQTQFAFVRWKGKKRLLIVSNFSNQTKQYTVKLPESVVQNLGVSNGSTAAKDLISGTVATFVLQHGEGEIVVNLPALASVVYEF